MKSSYSNPGKIALISLLFACSISGCKKLVEVDAPVNNFNAANVYTNDATAVAVLTGIYGRMSDQNSDVAADNITAISVYTALSADELILFNLNDTRLPFHYRNDLTNANGTFWVSVYALIFIANSAIEGLNNSANLTPAVKKQLQGEAHFIRAFCYFYLTNLFGDVPLVLTTDWKVNALLPRAPQAQVYQQVIADLKEAQLHLSTDYLGADVLSPTNERVRPTKWAATALLARVYLYTGDFINAEAEATAVITNTTKYSLTSLNSTFLKNSMETIWSLQPVRSGVQSNTGEGALFVLPATGPNTSIYPVYLSNNVVNSFEIGDQRKTSWTNSVTVGPNTYYYPFKYKIGRVNTTVQEYSMILRLGEQYLVRAEARAQLNNISGSQADLNAIRTRASLPSTTANDKPSLLAAILHERQTELFTEWGHRWLDLKRTNNIDAVMSIVSPQKGGTWIPYKSLYPIPQTEIDKNPNLVQNTGY